MSKVRRHSFTSVETSKREKMDTGRVTVRWCASGALEQDYRKIHAELEVPRERWRSLATKLRAFAADASGSGVGVFGEVRVAHELLIGFVN
jgi:hypothetical protein